MGTDSERTLDHGGPKFFAITGKVWTTVVHSRGHKKVWTTVVHTFGGQETKGGQMPG